MLHVVWPFAPGVTDRNLESGRRSPRMQTPTIVSVAKPLCRAHWLRSTWKFG